jgi:hypothetical protein
MNLSTRRSLAVLILIAATCALAACASPRIGEHGVASTKQIPPRFKVILEGVEGRSCSRMALFIPLGSTKTSIDAAIEAALEQAPGANALKDASSHQYLIPALLYNEVCWVVKGTAIRTE